MAEINFEEEWREIMVNLAAEDSRVRSVVSWLFHQEGHDSDSEVKYEYMARAACEHYGLDPDDDLDIVIEACEDRILEELYNG